jgi:hypothetical protein
MKSISSKTATTTWPLSSRAQLLAAYVAFGVLHELTHFIVASWLMTSSSASSTATPSSTTTSTRLSASSLCLLLGDFVTRAVLGRFSLVPVGVIVTGERGGVLIGSSSTHDENYDDPISDDADDISILQKRISIILHAGWICSLFLAVSCHLLHCYARRKKRRSISSSSSFTKTSFLQEKIIDIFNSPTLPIAAYITALEAISTDLLGFVPAAFYYHEQQQQQQHSSLFQQYPHLLHQSYHHGNDTDDHDQLLLLRCFCGNFGILLLNQSWLTIDGGRTALDILEKMINITMMRGTCTVYTSVDGGGGLYGWRFFNSSIVVPPPIVIIILSSSSQEGVYV